jgi:tRNA threonylcarbamoyl adenosine modification protein YjeE
MAADFLTLELPDEPATASFAEDVAAILAPGDVIALSGGLGAGKTTFARAAIRAAIGDPSLEVPSPTFTLVQTYAGDRFPIAHLDLYRVTGSDDLRELGLDEAMEDGVVLIEWPERAAEHLPADRLVIRLDVEGSGRRATLSGGEQWKRRIERTMAIRALLGASGWSGGVRRTIQGDASTRRYERVLSARRSAILMDWPMLPAAPISDRRSAFRAQDVNAVLAVDAALRGAGLSAPEVFTAERDAGLVLMEDFGNEGVLRNGEPVAERYAAAIDALATIHEQPRPDILPIPGDAERTLLRLSSEVLSADLTLFTEWYVPHRVGRRLDAASLGEFRAIWSGLFDLVAAGEQSWVLFDVQSPNLFWLPQREGVRRVGLIDFQDMFVGPSAYDVASLCQDARVTIEAPLETVLRRRYVEQRRRSQPGFDDDSFSSAYAILAVARGWKNLGVFARQADQFGKTHYLQHFPRAWQYLRRNLAHPVLSDLALWYERHLPADSQP